MRVRVSARAFVLLLACLFAFASAVLPSTKKPPAHPIDINSASSVQLQEVPGIGPATAEKILAMRKSYGAFKSVDDLLSVRGIGPKRLEKMRKYLVAGHAAPRRRPSGSNAASPPGGGKPAACVSRSGVAPTKKTAAVAASKPVSKPADTADSSDEEPE